METVSDDLLTGSHDLDSSICGINKISVLDARFSTGLIIRGKRVQHEGD
jgi:hypothetical protein